MLQQAIKEDLLHYIWRLKRFDYSSLMSTDGRSIKILDFGKHNSNAGPDFLEGKVKIDNTIWAGQIEMHVRASDWKRHRHQFDPRYNNVILHVVYDPDIDILDPNGLPIPCLDMSPLIDPYVRQNYSHLIQSESWIPCEKLINKIPPFKLSIWIESLIGFRYQEKTETLSNLLDDLKGDWESLFATVLFKTLGAKVNTEAFETLFRSIPISVFHKNCDKPLSISALLFGQAHMLHDSKGDDYYLQLRAEYNHLKQKYNLKPIEALLWKFSRMRPSSFPTIRIAQLAHLLSRTTYLFQNIRDMGCIEDIMDLFDIQANSYWDNHYRFMVPSKHKKVKKLGEASKYLLIVNAVVPTLFLYGQQTANYTHCENALHLLTQIPPEINTITKKFKTMGIPSENAAYTQALIQLKTRFCDHKKCLSCTIGHELMNKSNH